MCGIGGACGVACGLLLAPFPQGRLRVQCTGRRPAMARVERSSSGASDVVIRSDTRHATRFTTANPGVSHAESLADVVSIVRNDPSRLIEDEQFQCFMGGVIIVNILVLAGETDYPDLWIWTICNGFILALFTAEVLVKMWRYGFDAYFSGASIAWNVLDAAIVFLGMVELLLAALTGGAGSSCYSSVLRIVRLLRLLRLLRLFRVVKQLMALATAFQSMMASFAVVFAVLFLLLLVSSMLCTQCLGNATEFVSDTGEEEREELVRDIQVHFKDIPTTMFSLFQVTTLDNWIDIAKPAIMVDMRWQGFFVLFICAASWTMISILTAVASESVVESAMGREEAMQKEEQQMQKKFFDFLRKAFLEADADGNGLLDREDSRHGGARRKSTILVK